MMPVLIVIALLALTIVFIYNGLVRLRVQCDNAWADIDVQLKRRYDLIPNLVETVKGYAAHEKGTFDAVVSARNQAMSAQGPAAKGEAEGLLTGALRQVFALAEAYPQLRAVESFTQLQQTLNQIEIARSVDHAANDRPFQGVEGVFAHLRVDDAETLCQDLVGTNAHHLIPPRG